MRFEQGTAVIEIPPADACTKCCSCSAAKPKQVRIDGGNMPEVAVGDMVTVDIDTSSMMKVYLMVYALPLLVFVSTLLCAYALSRSPIVSFAAGLGATAVTYFFISRYIKSRPVTLPQVSVIKDDNVKNPANF
jgi:positive regulator of sigma E activity